MREGQSPGRSLCISSFTVDILMAPEADIQASPGQRENCKRFLLGEGLVGRAG